MNTTRPQGGRERLGVDGGKLGRELLGLFAIFCGLLVALSLITFDSRDPWLNHVVSGAIRVHNKAGLFGSYLAGLLLDIIGVAAWAFPAFFCLAGVRRIIGAAEWPWWRWVGFILLGVSMCLAGAASDLGDVEIFARGILPQGAGNVSAHGGGIIGQMLYVGIVGWMSPVGAFLVWFFSLILALQMLSGISLPLALAAAAKWLYASLSDATKNGLERREERKQAALAAQEDERRFRNALPLPVTVISKKDGEQPRQEVLETAVATPASVAAVQPQELVANTQSASTQAAAAASPSLIREPVIRIASDHTLVHPMLHQPEPEEPAAEAEGLSLLPWDDKNDADAQPADNGHVPNNGNGMGLGQSEDEEDDLPPWVRDFEQGRVGVQPASAPENAQAPSLSEDSDLLDILWGPEERDEPAVSGSNTGRAVDATKSAATAEHLDAEISAPMQEPPAVSAQTNAAIEALRTAAASPPQTLRAGPGALTLDDAGVPPPPEAPAITAPAAPETAPVLQESSAYNGEIRINETPPVASASPEPAPGLVGALLERVRKPVRAKLPSLDLLQDPAASSGGTPHAVLEGKGRSLMTCLHDFGIQGELVGITPGPVVTMFEVRPAPGVRVSRIANLSDDLALALKAVAVRIQAPVPGTDTVGIEIPNEVRETVSLKELLGSQVFRQAKSLLTLAIGKDIAGHPAVADLATMPHLLVAGATGAGKSVGINSIILSLIYKARPEEVKLLLVDPKRVEMAIYADLPHLVHPVVTEMQLAKNALDWAVAEMEQRYNSIAKAGVRNIADYNAKLASFDGKPPEGMEDLEFMPYLVVVIDELADLMLVAAKEVETSIVRLAQLARAAGIHLILATQRPSVDVVTGLIKANFPCRISFQVTSKHDSRTILDTVGAEHLLGKGDMLFKPSGGKFVRMHGAFVPDKDVNAVVGYWKAQQKPDYRIDFADWGQEVSGGVLSGPGGNGGDIGNDPLYNEAVEFVRQQGKASISLIQRKFRIGFNKAARYVEQMEIDGIIGPADGSKPRLVNR